MELFEKIVLAIGVLTILGGLGFGITAALDFLKDLIDEIKRSYKIKHRFEKKPIAECHCIDCYYCEGYLYPDEKDSRVVSCKLWSNIVLMDDSFCYRADSQERWWAKNNGHCYEKRRTDH